MWIHCYALDLFFLFKVINLLPVYRNILTMIYLYYYMLFWNLININIRASTTLSGLRVNNWRNHCMLLLVLVCLISKYIAKIQKNKPNSARKINNKGYKKEGLLNGGGGGIYSSINSAGNSKTKNVGSPLKFWMDIVKG